ncbi:MAG: zinc ribbon domain-containing protein [Sandaracinus sp.]|nr:zinc ribbon domain-containing protein [Sandaracinus sp.]MCB9634890.1 zinc ribbon domain-containing protein [Sandaracinus sp.]
MPTYEYRCDACGHEFEKEQRISDKPIKKCPSCGAMKARRMIGGTGFILKGGGWYSDLYSGPSNSSAKSSSSESSSSSSESSSSSATTTTESKPAKSKKKKD